MTTIKNETIDILEYAKDILNGKGSFDVGNRKCRKDFFEFLSNNNYFGVKQLEEKETALAKEAERIRNDTYDTTATNEEFLVYLGNSVARTGVNVTGFNHMGTSEENGIYKMILDFELKGNGNSINSVLSDIDDMGIKYSVGSFSYRQNEQYNYLKRFYDELTDLPWYKEPEEEESTQIIEEIPQSEDTAAFDEEPFFYDDNNDYSEYIPYTPEPEMNAPENEEIPQETQPKEETPKSIDERLNELLELMDCKDMGYRAIYLDNKKEDTYKDGQQMRLAVTVCLIMFKEPKQDGSILKRGSFADGVF